MQKTTRKQNKRNTHTHKKKKHTSECSKTVFRPIQNFQKKVFDSSHPGGTFISVSAVYHHMYARRSSNDEPGNNEMGYIHGQAHLECSTLIPVNPYSLPV